jgi:hypothetical protein
MPKARRPAVRLDREIHLALRHKAAETGRSIAALVDAAVRQTLSENAVDRAAFPKRADAPNLDFESALIKFRRRQRR